MHYHKRSNIESAISMIKTKFGDSVRSKTDVAMRNEVLCKILCHNICCLIQSQCELGIEPMFWETRPVKTVEAEVVATAAPVAEAAGCPGRVAACRRGHAGCCRWPYAGARRDGGAGSGEGTARASGVRGLDNSSGAQL